MKFSKKKLRNLTFSFFFWIPVLIILILSTILTLSSAVKYRRWDIDLRWMHWSGALVWLVCYVFLSRKFLKKNSVQSFILFSSFQILIGIGLIVVWRLNNFFGVKQTIWMSISTILVGLLLEHPDILQKLKNVKYLLLIGGIMLILLTFFFGTYPSGSGPKLWLGSRGIYFQPSELLKIILIIFLAAYFADSPTGKFDILKNLFPTIILVLASFALLVFQRDMGTAIIFISIYILMVFAVYGKRRILLTSFIILAVISLLGYEFVDLIRIRFQAWIFPWYNSQTSSYQIVQSIIAIAAGGFLGTGLGLGYPNFVPLSHSDFIFTAIAEELGILGAFGVLLLFTIILFSGIRISLFARNRYERYLAIGLTGYILTQAILIIGGNIRLLPITGVTLPFISYGGSSLLISYSAFGILQIANSNTIRSSHVSIKPYRWIAAFFAFCIAATALTIGWWGIVHANDIQLRSDNPRNIIANIFVQRGSIFGRNNNILVYSEGIPGEIQRVYSYPALSNTLGYFSQKHGLAGIEASFDDYLRGYKGYPSQALWQSYLLYDQPPEGRSIRLTIALEMQQYVDQLLDEKKGSIVVMDADNGEILALANSPYFDANQLDSNWEIWHSDENAPLLNRATQGAYPIGGLISPLIFAEIDAEKMNDEKAKIFYSPDLSDTVCDLENQQTMTNAELLKSGCYSTALNLVLGEDAEAIFSDDLFAYLLTPSEVGLPAANGWDPEKGIKWTNVLSGDEMIRSNPLQIAASFLPLSNDGYQISPTLTSAVNVSSGDWVIISDPTSKEINPNINLKMVIDLLQSEDDNAWEISAITQDDNGSYAWFVTGTISEGSTKNYVTAIVFEGSTREEVSSAGKTLIRYLQTY